MRRGVEKFLWNQEGRFALILGDLDQLMGKVNALHGHAFGDTVLVTVARRLEADVGTLGDIYRFGGDEFLVALPGLGATEAAELAQRMEPSVEMPIEEGGRSVQIGITFGVVEAVGPVADPDELLRQLSEALTRAKDERRPFR